VLAPAAQVEFARRLIDGFEARVLRPLAAEFAGVFSYADVRGTLARDEWFDEMHPTGDGFRRIAAGIQAALVAVLPPGKR
jgi:hypothetical protein